MERPISFRMEREGYFAIIRQVPDNERVTVSPNDFFDLKVHVYYHQIHRYDELLPRLLYQFPSHCIPCNIFFQEGQTLLRTMLSGVHSLFESSDELINSIVSSIGLKFNVADCPAPSPESKRVPVGLIITLFDSDRQRAVMEESMESFRMLPASNEAIELFLKKSTVSTAGECCSVCLEDLDDNAECSAMPCKHVFHLQCIRTWLQTSHVCPLCRYALPTH